ncbi:hypothetical protein [Borreliella valaisiana]|nr:hypothetical protein [Borreliella valaisiana]
MVELLPMVLFHLRLGGGANPMDINKAAKAVSAVSGEADIRGYCYCC